MRALALALGAAVVAAASPVLTVPGFARIRGSLVDSGVHGDDGKPIMVAAFRNIPFAVAARWAPSAEALSVQTGGHPSPLRAKDGSEADLDGSEFGPGCNIASGAGLVPPEGDEQENCLTLSVWCVASADGSACADSGRAARPVTVFLHGGAFMLGSAKHPYAAPDPAAFVAATGAVYVKSQYRLGALGFMAHPAMPAEAPGGTFGLGDQIVGLQWVQRHAAAFGGDKERVLASGSSAGAISLCFHITDPASRGLFRTVMLQSPQCAYPFPAPASASAPRGHPDVTPLPAASPGGAADWLSSVTTSVPYAPEAEGLPWSADGAISLTGGGSRGVYPLPNGSVLLPRPAPAAAPELAAELVCMMRLDGQRVTDGLPPRRASFWFEGDLFFPVINGADVKETPGLRLARRGLADPGLTLLGGVQRSEGTLFAGLGFPVVAFSDLIKRHLASAMGEALFQRVWPQYFPPTREEMLLEGPAGAGGAGPAAVAEAAQALLDEAREDAEAVVEGAAAAVGVAPWRSAGRHTTRTPHHGAAPVPVSGPVQWLSNALGAREWSAAAHVLTDVWRCAFVQLARRASAISAGASLSPAAVAELAASGAAAAGDAVESTAEVAAASGEAPVTGRADAAGSSGGDVVVERAASETWVRSRFYAYHMLHAPSTLQWPMHRMGAFHGSEVGIFYNSTSVHSDDRGVAGFVQPLLNRTLWEGRPDAPGDCDSHGRPVEGRGPVWCPVMVPPGAAASAAANDASDLPAFAMHALHVTGTDEGSGMRPLLHERRGGHWVCEELLADAFEMPDIRFRVPEPMFEPVYARVLNVLIVRSAVAIVRRPTAAAAHSAADEVDLEDGNGSSGEATPQHEGGEPGGAGSDGEEDVGNPAGFSADELEIRAAVLDERPEYAVPALAAIRLAFVRSAKELDAVLAAFGAYPAATRESSEDGAAPASAGSHLLHVPLFAHQLFGHEEAVVGYEGVKCLVCFAEPSMRCLVVTRFSGRRLDDTMVDDLPRRLAAALHPGAATDSEEVFRAHLTSLASADPVSTEPTHPDKALEAALVRARKQLAQEAEAATEADGDAATETDAAEGSDDDEEEDEDEDEDEDEAARALLPLPTKAGMQPMSSADRPDLMGVPVASFGPDDGGFEVRVWGADSAAAGELQRRVEALCMWMIESADGIALDALPWTLLGVFQRASPGKAASLAGYASVTRFVNPFRGDGGVVLRLGQLVTVPAFQRRGVASALYAALHGLARATGAAAVTIEGPSDGLSAVRDRVELALALRCPALVAATPEAARRAASAGRGSAAWSIVSVAQQAAAVASKAGGDWLGPAFAKPVHEATAAGDEAVAARMASDGVAACARIAADATRPASDAVTKHSSAWTVGLRRAVKRRCLRQLKEGSIEDAEARHGYLESRYRAEVAAFLRAAAGLGLVTKDAVDAAAAESEAAEEAFERAAERARARQQQQRTRDMLQKVVSGELDTDGDPDLAALVKMVQAAAGGKGAANPFA
ncbi:hypothetical protein FNF29_02415 [Cafeteria roenbergensis]|uniref:N-acetyltransferase domain-containing protein n=1 Tax=Cafeteria roenbergensis TaxID=33653 RepID=A0A5A8CPA8_CAFRO|nr:hypothetical protein FNF29_02415 [Cafeteria roenbergensis]|eukprot:KAA0154538.1 hypothetical protein FNF29_02415 [Cafeteria roenbergensis]